MNWLAQNWIELLGNALAFLDIYLIYKNSVWNWPIGILNCAFYIALFLPAKLYADSFLQVLYIGLSGYGWWWWLGGFKREEEPVRAFGDPGGGSKTYIWAMVILILICPFTVNLLKNFSNSDVPLYDGLLMGVCIGATFLMAKRRLENWHLWILSNVGYFFLYAHKHLVITQWCQIGFLLLSVFGLMNWRSERKNAIASGRLLRQPV